MRIDINDFNRKAKHILETVVKPQVEKYELSKQTNKYTMETKNNSGSIFKNNYKKSESHPDYKGKCMVNGKEMEIALWVKDTKTGEKFFSTSFSEPYVAPEATNPPVIVSDDLPF